jgi:hypothetical protein
MAAPRKKKFLKLEDGEYGGGEDAASDQEEDAEPDIKDIEFRLRNDSSQVKVRKRMIDVLWSFHETVRK